MALVKSTDIVYHGMGDWKSKIRHKKERASRTKSKPSRVYKAYPPKEGWPGGPNCAANGWKKGSAK